MPVLHRLATLAERLEVCVAGYGRADFGIVQLLRQGGAFPVYSVATWSVGVLLFVCFRLFFCLPQTCRAVVYFWIYLDAKRCCGEESCPVFVHLGRAFSSACSSSSLVSQPSHTPLHARPVPNGTAPFPYCFPLVPALLALPLQRGRLRTVDILASTPLTTVEISIPSGKRSALQRWAPSIVTGTANRPLSSPTSCSRF